jgi:hypothetical protein
MGVVPPMIYVTTPNFVTPWIADVRLYIINLVTGNPVVGMHGTWTTTLGTLSDSSFETDDNGMAETQLIAGTQPGMAIVLAMPDDSNWPVAIDVPILAQDELPVNIDRDQEYQLFIQGKQYKFSDGPSTYTRSYTMAPQNCSILLPKIAPEINAPLLIHIYRRGVLDWSGRVSKYKRTIDNKLLITGLSNHVLLGRRVVTANYTEGVDVASLIPQLLFNYPVGITAGHIDDFSEQVTAKFYYDPLSKALANIQSQTNWGMRVNVDETLDFGDPSGAEFARQPPVTFTTGDENTDVEDEIDFSKVVTQSYMVGQPNTLVSSKIDTAAAAAYGLMDGIHSASQLKDQKSLDLANLTYLNTYKNPLESTTVQTVDEQVPAGSYNPWDFITITDPNTGLSGLRRLTQVDRDMMQKGLVKLGFVTILPSGS